MNSWHYKLCLSPDKCCLQVGRMFYLPFKSVPSSMSICATVTVGTGRTARRLQDHIKQHVPKWLRQHTASQRVQPNRACKRKQPTPECDSAIGQHLLENDQCAANYNDDQFSIPNTARSLFHLSLLKASLIKVRRPNLCKQKEFVYTLKLFK